MTPFCKPTVSCKNGVLAIDVSNSKVPGVVRVDVSAAPFSHFHVRSNDEGSVLGYTDGGGRFVPIALFGDRGEADRVLRQIKKTLVPFDLLKKLKIFLAAISCVFVALLIIYLLIGPAKTPPAYAPPSLPGAAVPAPSGPEVKPGVPADADSLFNSE